MFEAIVSQGHAESGIDSNAVATIMACFRDMPILVGADADQSVHGGRRNGGKGMVNLFIQTERSELCNFTEVERTHFFMRVLVEDQGGNIERAGADIDKHQRPGGAVAGIDITRELGGNLWIETHPIQGKHFF